MNFSYKPAAISGLILLLSDITSGQTKWTADKSHSSVKFTVIHMVVSEVEGRFRDFTGIMTASKPDFTDAVIDFTVKVASINTENEGRDNHLKKEDFFDAEKYPEITFKSTRFKKLHGKKYELAGNLTMRDVTKEVKFDVTYGGTIKAGSGRTIAGFKAISKINRFDYHLNWNKLTEAGGLVVGPDVGIIIDVEFRQEK